MLPALLNPVAQMSNQAILVSDPGLAFFLAKQLLVKPLMSHHQRGLWGYTGDLKTEWIGRSAAITIQSAGVGGASCSRVVDGLADHGIRRLIWLGEAIQLEPASNVGPEQQTFFAVDQVFKANGAKIVHSAYVDNQPQRSSSADANFVNDGSLAKLPSRSVCTFNLTAEQIKDGTWHGLPSEATLVDGETADVFTVCQQRALQGAAILRVDSKGEPDQWLSVMQPALEAIVN